MAGWVYWEAPIRNNFLWKGLIERNLLLCSSLKLKVWCTYWNFRMRFSGFQEFNLNGCSSAWKLPFPGFRNCEFLFKIKEKFAFCKGIYSSGNLKWPHQSTFWPVELFQCIHISWDTFCISFQKLLKRKQNPTPRIQLSVSNIFTCIICLT